MLKFKFFAKLLKMTNRTIMNGNVSNGTKTSRKQVKKERFQHSVPSVIELAAVGHGYNGTAKCLVVNMSNFKYMFNCGEGTQRIATEHKKLRGTNRIFLTHGKWQNVGGLIGLSLTLENAELKKLILCGPPKVEHHVMSSLNFSRLEKIDIVKEEISTNGFQDQAMSVEYIPLLPDEFSDESKESFPKRMKLSSDVEEHVDMAVAYLCKPHAKPRNVDLEKCSEMNVPAGPHLALLKEEKEITLPGTDRIIKPDDVLSPKEPNDPFLVVECPTIGHLESLVSSPLLSDYQCSGDNDVPSKKVCLVVHFTHSSIMSNPVYLDWMKKFGAETNHMVLNDLCCSVDTESMHRVQAARNLIHPHIFPLLKSSSSTLDAEDNKRIAMIHEGCNKVHYAKTNTKYIYRPITEQPFDEEQCLKLDTQKFIDETLVEPSSQEFFADWRNQFQDVVKVPPTPSNPEIVFLGTGSAVPNKYRNVSCILLNVGEDSSIILDCGENSCGQLYRLYGVEEGKKKLRNLKAVFVSHLHADHHLGLIGLAIERQMCLEEERKMNKDDRPIEPLIVLAPKMLHKWYTAVDCDDIPINRIISFLPCHSLYTDKNSGDPLYQKLLNLLDFEKVSTVRVQHSQFPHGIVLQHKSGWKLVYSGDTMPSNDLIRAGKGCDLLIHEATFDACKVEEAKEKKHSTSDQAIEVGRSMEARFTLLTHFSQRYDKVPIFSDNFTNDVGVAFDNLTVKLSDLHLLPKFVPAYKVVYQEEYREMLETIENKQFRAQLAALEKQSS